jgi:hypothetical protein
MLKHPLNLLHVIVAAVVLNALSLYVSFTAFTVGSTYYVSTSSPGSSCTTALDPTGAITPQEAVSLACTTAGLGDNVVFLDGTYTTAINWSSLCPSGTASLQTVCRSLNKWGALIAQTGLQTFAEIAPVNRSYITIEGFDIDASSQGASDSSRCIHLDLTASANQPGVQILNNRCQGHRSNGIAADNNGSFFYTNILIKGNLIWNPGSPAFTSNGAPHGIYVRTQNSRLTQNTVYSPVAGTAGSSVIQCRVSCLNTRLDHNLMYANGDHVGFIGDGSTSLMTNIQYDHNTIKAVTGSAGVCLYFHTGQTNSKFFHNVCDGFTTFIKQRSTAGTGNVATNNICITGGACTITDEHTPDDITLVDNIPNAVGSGGATVATSNFNDRANGDYSLVAGAATLIDQGTVISGQSYNDGGAGNKPDLGAFERVGFSSALINEAFLDVTIGQNIAENSPIRPTAAGWSAACTGTNCGTPVVGQAQLLTGTSNVVRLSITGIGGGGVCAAGQTWTVSYNPATGATTDSIFIGNTINQELSTITTQAVTNGCGVAPPSPPAGVEISYGLDENAGTTATDGIGGDQNGTLTNTPSWVAPGQKGASAVGFTSGSTQYIAVPYGSAVNPTTTGFTDCMWVKADTASNSRIFFGADNGTDQRFYLGFTGSTLSMGIQASPFATNVDFPISDVYVRACIRMDAATDTATLAMNGVVGTSAQSVKSYTSYTLASNMRLGLHVTTGGVYSGGTTIDEYRHYNTALSNADILADFNNAQPPPPPAAGTLTQVGFKFCDAKTNFLGALTCGALNTNITVPPGGAFAVVLQTDCTGANCASLAQQYRYSCTACPGSAGNYLVVPDTATADKISFFGDLNETGLLSGTVTCCLSGALTATDGGTQHTATAVPVFQLNQNASIVHRPMFRVEYGATPGWQYCIRAYDQSGNALDAYSQTACVTVVTPFASGAGF